MQDNKKSIDKINSLITRIDDLKRLKRGSPDFKKWLRDTQVALEYIFGKESRHITDFDGIRYSLGAFNHSTQDYEFQQRYVYGLENAKQVLISMIEEIQEYWVDGAEDTSGSSDVQTKSADTLSNTNKVFIIHGHDAGAKETVARFIS